ncbi:hypothetical protein SCHPADRAFT_875833 [Schizopora paradoxa]|uniref:Thioesterase/thiol ester dehydrase-isomerase n=1 Tax=Schizopora paradoxa TaxID=27342 RepID=A0A0H2RKK1_9AGAM|nr:hypothetical protein SCHPADRAFT_875833 [Schizopora paradoxa]
MSSIQTISLTGVRNALKSLGELVWGDSSKSILPFIPRPIRYLVVLLLIVNARSFPFTWHYRMFSPVAFLRLNWWIVRLSGQSKEKWLDSRQPIGRSPFSPNICKPYKSWASPDESDYNIHLSNSSYAKTLDAVRLNCALECFLAFFRDGGWIALGGTHFNFIREIPIGASYEVRSTFGSWDGKWMYVVSRFVSKSKRATVAKNETKKRLQEAQAGLRDEAAPSTSVQAGIPSPLIHTPAAAIDLTSASGSSTPAVQVVSNRALDESDDEVLHCIGISQVCFKIGRITVPPALVLASNGFGLSNEKWQEIKQLRSRRSPDMKAQGGKSGISMRELLKGGWKDVPGEDRWWDQALAGMEEERVRKLEVFSRLKEGVEGARAL